MRRFVPNFSEVTAPLVELTRKDYSKQALFRQHWGSAQTQAVTQAKELLISPPVLHFPDFSKEFVVHVDASDAGVGAFLAQLAGDGSDKNDLNIIAYYSKRFTKGQSHYSATMKECCGVVLTLHHWRPYFWGRHFTCVTDHSALTYLFHMQDTSNMLTRWAIALQGYDFTVEHKPGKLHVIPDTLSKLRQGH